MGARRGLYDFRRQTLALRPLLTASYIRGLAISRPASHRGSTIHRTYAVANRVGLHARLRQHFFTYRATDWFTQSSRYSMPLDPVFLTASPTTTRLSPPEPIQPQLTAPQPTSPY